MLSLSKIFRGGPHEAFKALEDHVKILKSEVLKYLSNEKYVNFGPDAAKFSCALLNYVCLYDSASFLTTKDFEINHDLLVTECKCIKNDKRLCGKDGGISYLMAAEIYKKCAILNDKDVNWLRLHSSIRVITLLNKNLKDYGIWMPGKLELGSNNDPWEFSDNIGHFAMKYIKEKLYLPKRDM